jgi:hypothetical protein
MSTNSQMLHFGNGSVTLTARESGLDVFWNPHVSDRKHFIQSARRFLDVLEALTDLEGKLLDNQQAQELEAAEVRWISQQAEVEKVRKFG